MNEMWVFAINSIMGMLVGIIAIIGGYIIDYHKKKNEKEIRQSIINNHVDMEIAKILVKPMKKEDKYNILLWGCVLLGLGLGYAVALLLGINEEKGLGLWIILAVGIGFGMFVSFFLKNKMEAKEHARQEESNIEKQ
ncbi:DUF6249 domain-containing protein [Hoylesella oralis]|uniref:DUF6249 domain-containing protein n=1 Tax=Hoylesella oralis TaxID=28134 RepID=UPI0011600C26|nr:DUF6249 domain-containing protein [Hoylesella oralis]